MNRKTSMSDSIGTTAYTYDALGNLVVEDGPFADDTLYYDYTTDGRIVTLPRHIEPKEDTALLIHQLGLPLPPQPPPRISAAQASQTTM